MRKKTFLDVCARTVAAESRHELRGSITCAIDPRAIRRGIAPTGRAERIFQRPLSRT
jgi:hypothetical protein